jgi:hypothetical protein
MMKEKGDEVDFEGKVYTIVEIYSRSVLLKVRDGNKLYMTGLSFLETLHRKNEKIC